jgi:hypothetical protein
LVVLIDAARRVDDPRRIEQPLRERGLAGAYMSEDPQVERLAKQVIPSEQVAKAFVDMTAARMCAPWVAVACRE